MESDNKSRLIFPAAIFIAYAVLRFWHLTDSCLWFDEIFSVHAAEHGWREIFRFVAQDLIHPPLFYVILKFWITIGGETLFWLRCLPAVISCVAFIPLYLLCRQLKLPAATAALALVLFTVNGPVIKYSQEVRMYSLLMCLSLFSLWLFARFLNVGKGIWVLTAVNVLLVQTHYFGWLLVVAEIAAVLYLQRIKIGQMMIMFAVTAVGFLWWIFALFKSARAAGDLLQNLGWAERPNLRAVVQFVFNLLEPFYYKASSADPVSILAITIPLLLIILAGAGIYFAGGKNHTEKDRNLTAFLTIMIFTPTVLAFAASWILPFSIWGARHLVIVFAPAAILAAHLLGNIRMKGLKLTAAALVSILCLSALWLHVRRGPETFVWCAWEDLANRLPTGSSAGPIMVFDDLIAYHFWFALRNQKDVRVVKINGVPEMQEDKAYFLPRGFDGVETSGAEGLAGDRFYVAFYARDFNYLKQPLRSLTERGYRIGEPQVFEAGDLKAYLTEVTR